MDSIQVIPLGAGQDVGRSCIIVTIGGKNVMLDCGMHMGYNDERRFPDFTFFTQYGSLNDFLSCVIISHFHLDHCGALPYMTEVVGFDGPIYMTQPTKAICPILLEDYRKVMVERKGEKELFTSEHIKQCMKKVTAVNLHELVKVEDDLYIKPYYAGHVLGAAMFLLKYGEASVLYTGDFNMTPDRHLGAAWVDKCRPDLLITESTYATTVRDSKRCRESEFLKKIHECVENGGKVLIPVFALGRAQELCILLDSYWERMNIKVPIYFSMGLTEKATYYYRMFISWTNEKIKKTFVDRNMFDFKHIKPFDKSYTNLPEAMVVFATPGMLHGGQSLAIFRHWAGNERNMVVLPGYCVKGTVGQKILSGCRLLEFENNTTLEVKMAVEYMSFSAHADAKGILQLIRNCEPKNVMLVHGEGEKMGVLAQQIRSEFEIDCFYPANGENVTIPVKVPIYADMSIDLLINSLPFPDAEVSKDVSEKKPKRRIETSCELRRKVRGTLLIKDNRLKLLPTTEALLQAKVKPHVISFINNLHLIPSNADLELLGKKMRRGDSENLAVARRDFWADKITRCLDSFTKSASNGVGNHCDDLHHPHLSLHYGSTVSIKSGNLSKASQDSLNRLSEKLDLTVSWDLEDDHLGTNILKHLQKMQEFV